MFIGRRDELKMLHDTVERKNAQFVVLRGRRRIGKSTLIEHFAHQNQFRFIKLEGLPPAKGQTGQDQLNYFSQMLSRQTDWPKLTLSSWPDAFLALKNEILKVPQKTLVLIDEISWLGQHNVNFAGYLKSAWDNEFKKIDHLCLVLCGSISTWIEENILNHTAFVGRISQVLDLGELPLNDAAKFWQDEKISSFEKYKFLSISGGIPRYLEELRPQKTADENIAQLAFLSQGLLYHEFDDLFNESYNLANKIYRQVLIHLADGPLSFVDICEKLKTEKNGKITTILDHLMLAGFIKRDYSMLSDGSLSKLSRYRLSDNYARFYLKYILPNRKKIEANLMNFSSIDQLPGWQTMLGFQFQNLMNNSLKQILNRLHIDLSTLLFAGPYFQTRTKVREAVEIDLLVFTRNGNYFLIECKFKKKIGTDVIKEVQSKVEKLQRKKYTSLRTVLIYEGELSDAVVDAGYFSEIIHAGEFLTSIVP